MSDREFERRAAALRQGWEEVRSRDRTASETPYVETEALLAVMNEDDGRLQHLLDGMSHSELALFARQLDNLLHAVRRAWSR
jgi:hypothetical protein